MNRNAPNYEYLSTQLVALSRNLTLQLKAGFDQLGIFTMTMNLIPS